MQLQEPRYKKIFIQELEKRFRPTPSKFVQQNSIRILSNAQTAKPKPVLCYMDTGISEDRFTMHMYKDFHQSNFFSAFQIAYKNHGDILLIPDQIWIMILFYVSKYIDKSAKKLRNKLVKHEGVKTLTVYQCADSKEQSLLMQKNWDHFFQQIRNQVKKNTVENTVQNFECNFTTTTPVYKTISTALAMNSFKSYFKYSRNLGISCGIENVFMAGQRNDWLKIMQKLQNMVQYDVDGELKNYISHMKIIIQNFIATFDGKPDIQWWNSIMTKNKKMGGCCGMPITKQIDGWLLNFYGIYKETTLESFPSIAIQVSITLQNKWTTKEKECTLVADWVSISKYGQNGYKPDLGLAIFEVSEKNI